MLIYRLFSVYVLLFCFIFFSLNFVSPFIAGSECLSICATMHTKKNNNVLKLWTLNHKKNCTAMHNGFQFSHSHDGEMKIIIEERKKIHSNFLTDEYEIKKFLLFSRWFSVFNKCIKTQLHWCNSKKKSRFALLSHWQNRSIRSQNLNYYYSIVFHTVNTHCLYSVSLLFFLHQKNFFFHDSIANTQTQNLKFWENKPKKKWVHINNLRERDKYYSRL